MQPFTCSAMQPSYRLIDSGCEPHTLLDGLYSSSDEAIVDAIAWVAPHADPHHPTSLIGVDVSTADGNWRTCRMPGPLLCHLPCMVPG